MLSIVVRQKLDLELGDVDIRRTLRFAAFALEADIRAKTRDGPFVGAAGVLFAEAQMIVKLEVGEHGLGNMEDWNLIIETQRQCDYKLNCDKLRRIIR